MARKSKYSPEVQERAVRMVFGQQGQHASQWEPINGLYETELIYPNSPWRNGQATGTWLH